MSYKVKKGVVYSKRGIPQPPRWFADGRLAFQMTEAGIDRVQYMGPRLELGNHTLFLQRLFDGFRYYLEKDCKTYKPVYENCKVWPFGIESQWMFEGCMLGHSVLAVDEAIVIELSTPQDMVPGTRFKLEFHDWFAFIPTDPWECRFGNPGIERKWKEWHWHPAEHVLAGGFTSVPREAAEYRYEPYGNEKAAGAVRKSSETRFDICIASDFPSVYERKETNVKHILRSVELEPCKTYRFLVLFDTGEEGLQKPGNRVAQMKSRIGKQYGRYREVVRKSPVLKSPYKALNEFFSLAPLYHEVSKVSGIPGAIRASNVHYWVWGWDGITSNYCTAYWGDVDHIRDMLNLYETTADPEKGYATAFRHDMSFAWASALPSQGMYVCLLQLYYTLTGDMEAVRRHYAFARKLFRLTAETEVRDTGFCKGTSLYPDFPVYMKETGEDLSTFNNTVFYCSARSMEYLAGLVDDIETRQLARSLFLRIEDSFSRLFFNKKKGFYVSSVDSDTLVQRDSYNLSSIKRENNYLAELLEPLNRQCMGFIADNLVSDAGLREVPLWSDTFDGEANQLHCWWPINSEYFIHMVNQNNRSDLIDKFIGYIGHWTRKLTCPEGIPYNIETDDPDSDRWNTLQGAWQTYSIRGWYQAVVHGIVGIGIEAGGITVYPYEGEEMSLKGFQYGSRLLDVEMSGSGRYIKEIFINGITLKGTNKLPADLPWKNGGGRNGIRVVRVEDNPYSMNILSGYGIELYNYDFDGETIRACLCSPGTGRLKIAAVTKPSARINGMEAHVEYDKENGIATVSVMTTGNAKAAIEIHLLA